MNPNHSDYYYKFIVIVIIYILKTIPRIIQPTFFVSVPKQKPQRNIQI